MLANVKLRDQTGLQAIPLFLFYRRKSYGYALFGSYAFFRVGYRARTLAIDLATWFDLLVIMKASWDKLMLLKK